MAATSSEILLKLRMISDISDVTGNVKQVQQALNRLEMPKDMKSKFTGIFSNLEVETKKYQELLNSGFKGKKDVSGLESSAKTINRLLKELETGMKGIDPSILEKSFKVDPTKITKMNQEMESLKNKMTEILSGQSFKILADDAQKAANAMSQISKSKFTGDFLESVKKGDIEGASNALQQLTANHKRFKDETKEGQYQAAFGELQRILNELKGNNSLQEITSKIQTLKTDISNINVTELEKFTQTFQNGSGQVEEMASQVRNFTQANKESAVAQQRTNSQLDQLKSRVQYFFGLTNSIQLFRRAVTSALNTVKELDATMTETAVVTEFDIGDMWEQLPKYSKEAQALGVSINGMYQATTLYYQQGLKTNEAMELGVETMKMAKIAGMESAEATEAMTAALRGFNMELNETSATRVNDVYSQLAAVTAADTEQIATAMEKTASIAASANMEFETTAALLAQIIETTQEAPETAGTAMKTIIARFAEVKSLREKGLTTGEDEEGEEINVNNIQKALRSVGISMEGFFGGTEGLDSVLLKLAEKWNTLDFETQRYVATMAAGSRQQSRFIAMMSDYGRTTELVGEAQNSAGASQRQFEKTQESLDTSLTRLKNTWNEFLMGLANNEVLKGAIDSLTRILETVNKLTGSSKGLGKSISSLVTVLATLKIGKTLVGGTALGAGLGGLMTKFGLGGKTSGPSRFGVAQGFQEDPNWSRKQVMKESYHAKRVEIKASRAGRPRGLSQYFTKADGPAELKHNIRASAKAAATPEEANKFYAIDKQLKKGTITTEEAAKRYEELGGKVNKASVDFQGLGKAVSGAGMAMMAAGAATSLLSSLFSALGMEEEAEAVQKVSGVLMGLGSVLMMIGSFLPTLTTMTAAQAAATWAAVWPVLAIMAALVALIAIIVLVAKALNEASLEGRMKAAAEATENAKKAAEGAKEAYDKLLETKSGYDELQNKLDELTKGTLEWKEALAESNAQVLELLSTYPVLAQYLTRGKHGELEIADEGWDKIIAQQAQAVKNASAALIASQMDETKLQQEKNESLLREKAYQEGITRYDAVSETYVLDEEALEKIYEKYQKEGEDLFRLDSDGSYSKELEDFAMSIGQTAEEVYNLKDSLGEYEKTLLNNQTTLQAQTEALLTNQVSEEVASHEFGDELISGMSQGFAVNQDAIEKDIAAKVNTAGKRNEWRDNEYFQGLAKEYGLTNRDFTGKDKDDLEILYAKMAEINREDIADGLKGDRQKLAQEIAKIQAAKQAGEETEKVFQYMARLERDTQQEYSVLLSGDIANANQEVIDKISNSYHARSNPTDSDFYNEAYAEQMAKDLGMKDAAALAKSKGYEDETETAADGTVTVVKTAVQLMLEDFQKLADTAIEAREEITKTATKRHIDLDKDFLRGASVKQIENYTKVLTQGITLGTKDELEAGFEEIFAQVTDSQRDQILSLMETFDWTKEGAGEEFLEMLKEIAPNIDTTTEAFKAFIPAIKQVNAIYRDFDLSDIFNNVKKGLEEAEEIAGQSELSHEQYEKFLKEGLINSDDWSFNGKGWVNVTSGMDNLVEALKQNTLATYESTVAEAEQNISFYDRKSKEISKLSRYAHKDPTTGEVIFSDNPSFKFQGFEKASLDDIAKQLAGGTASESVWSKVFTTEDEYNRWVELYNGGLTDAKNLLAANEKFNFEDVQVGEEVEAYDKYYSVYQKLEGLARKREQLEKERNKLLEEGNVQEALQKSQAKRDLLKQEYEEQKSLKGKLQADAVSLMKQLNSLIPGANVHIDENGAVQFDEEVVNKISSGQKREEFDTLFSDLEETQGRINDADNTMIDIEVELYESEQDDRSEYIEAMTKVKDALVGKYEKQIDELKNINDSINDTNSKILESMQEQLADARQARDNAKTEQELEDKQRRLAYLQQDTSGANAQEILELQKEIEEGQESYTDQLIDQKISELQKQNDKAAEQRQHQIEILEEQRRLMEEGGAWGEAKTKFEEAFVNGELNMNSELVMLMKEADGFDQMSEEEQKQWEEEIRRILGAGYLFTHTQYATGGLADFTGPAWLDGTKSRPEYVLNAGQTEAFFTLVDVLSGLGLGGTTTTQNSGDNTYDIDINVESIGSDYDVERIADKVKTLIVNDSRYRNNNVLK